MPPYLLSSDIFYWKPSRIVPLFTSLSLFPCTVIWFISSSPNRPKFFQDRDIVWFGLSGYYVIPVYNTPFDPYFCCCLVTNSCMLLCDPMDYSLHGSSFPSSPGKNSAISFSRRSARLVIESKSPGLAGRFFTTEPPGKPQIRFFLFTP